jgi:hypothetical protein
MMKRREKGGPDMKEPVSFERLDGTPVTFEAHKAGWRELTPAQAARIERLFKWIAEQDRKWAERVAAGRHILKGGR